MTYDSYERAKRIAYDKACKEEKCVIVQNGQVIAASLGNDSYYRFVQKDGQLALMEDNTWGRDRPRFLRSPDGRPSL
jgi:hypothetical protein